MCLWYLKKFKLCTSLKKKKTSIAGLQFTISWLVCNVCPKEVGTGMMYVWTYIKYVLTGIRTDLVTEWWMGTSELVKKIDGARFVPMLNRHLNITSTLLQHPWDIGPMLVGCQFDVVSQWLEAVGYSVFAVAEVRHRFWNLKVVLLVNRQPRQVNILFCFLIVSNTSIPNTFCFVPLISFVLEPKNI